MHGTKEEYYGTLKANNCMITKSFMGLSFLYRCMRCNFHLYLSTSAETDFPVYECLCHIQADNLQNSTGFCNFAAAVIQEHKIKFHIQYICFLSYISNLNKAVLAYSPVHNFNDS